ncbi:unnamed protein product [Penicillium nalgiovense]|uniref:Rhodopsin domain-containing protein n=1 Tax=Penicillium nalgiovense TaxID=60175 RepID=A0A9W4MM62_PENNA|nr:unnamed protein product [Penicillium nalgiovense]CAG8028322.1 unnamed protein product [Penicillium nalgiovense]CAG8034012.1 unnamed protein product [Penicillium nalgiovense]CAG8037626.1 unnamed protein product [Penicillium nalgiovense]CAG8041383.1 unnamed protein product [Penicillium nalgiovense]
MGFFFFFSFFFFFFFFVSSHPVNMANLVNIYWKNVLTIVPIIGAVLATMTYLLRLYGRRMKAVGLHLEDYLMGAGLIISYCVTAFVPPSMVSVCQSHPSPRMNGSVFNSYVRAYDPYHKTLIVWEHMGTSNISQGSWMIQKFWAPSMACVKISIVVFIKRLFSSIRAYVIVSNCLIGFIATWALAALLTNIFQCTPVQYYYDKDLKGHCMPGQVQFFQAMGSIALVEDIIIFCLPIPVFWRLQVNRRQKIGLILVFSLGLLVCIFSLMRLIEFRKFQLTDLAASSAKESIWTCLELDVAIICGCLPFLNPLVQGVRSKVRSDASRYHTQPSTGSNLHLHSMRGNKGDFRALGSDCGASANSNGHNAMATAGRQSPDMENNRDVDGRSSMAHNS